MSKEIITIAEGIFEKLKIANHYISEWEQIMLQGNSDNGYLFKKYYFSLGFIRHAYLYMSILTLCTVIDNTGTHNIKNLREKIQTYKSLKIEELTSYIKDDKNSLSKTMNGLKLLRDKTIAHTENLDQNIIFKEAGISKEDISLFINNVIKYINYLMSFIDYKKDFILPNCSDYGINLIYKALENTPKPNLDEYTNIWQDGFNAGKNYSQS
ncbi:Uncharacterised protein [Stutzerimonas stutzeri]|nr:Uncharacterised protein [Stutzerimonas stutzeri]